jgi:hypothetical protein
MRSSVYTKAMLSDVTRALPFVAAAVALAAGISRLQRPSNGREITNP